MKNTLLLCLMSLLLLAACSESDQSFVPKPRGYFRIDLPAHAYQTLEPSYPFLGQYTEHSKKAMFAKAAPEYPFSFEYSKHAVIKADKSDIAEPYWIEIVYPELSAVVHLSYKKINQKDALLREFVNDSHKLATKHNIKASSIEEMVSKTAKGDGVIFFRIEGDVPSTFQCNVTDSSSNFLRAALYFPTSVKNDSLAPVIEYVKEDIVHMVNSLEWKSK